MQGLRDRIDDEFRISCIVRVLHDLHARSNKMKIEVVSVAIVSIFWVSSFILLASLA